VYPSPPGTSPAAVTTPLPGTGPYMITAYEQDQTFTLERNPHFKRWSFAAQPDGYPDVIRWLKVPDDRAGADAVISGRADVAGLTDVEARRRTPGLVDELKIRYPALVHSDLFAGTAFMYLNAAVPPFNNIKARQAVNYAVARGKMVELSGGPSVAVETCQMLPPKFPSYSWYCPYTTGPSDGRYHGPDLAKARELVKASRTEGMHVTVHGLLGGLSVSFDAYFARLLDQLGYDVTLHEMPDTGPNRDFLYNRRNHLQVQAAGWGADFPLASNFYDAVAGCDSEINVGEYCDRTLDQRAAAATTLGATDPGAALREWTQIDRMLTDDAAIVPITNQINSWLVSAKVRNFQSNQYLGPVLSQLWVK
jgi:peptide/nickel transport system substrate-binding protein